MTPIASQWTSLVLFTTVFIFAPLMASLPLPGKPSIPTSSALEPRSPLPDPRMIPDKTDLLAHVFASLGIEELNKFNKIHPEEYDDGPSTIDDSHSPTHTVTSHENDTSPLPSGEVKTEVHVDENGEETTTKKGQDAAEDEEDLMETLFAVLRKKFREVINSSDEVGLI
ncbi:uncharacterized protein BJX67DRAFT_376923 [Aspergillus lucknowensis]|uniref:Uncharacterized protein n=1 Tax=Aspergillus lucknowensis TaxID=176173 RepID=A0ABR4M660_9EURO